MGIGLQLPDTLLYENLVRLATDHYWLAQAYEASGWTSKAIEQYETFLDIWKNADEGLTSVKDAKARLARLKKI